MGQRFTSRICCPNFPVQITRLARGVTTGSILEYTNKEVLADALTGRQRF
jgi:recombination protein RecR